MEQGGVTERRGLPARGSRGPGPWGCQTGRRWGQGGGWPCWQQQESLEEKLLEGAASARKRSPQTHVEGGHCRVSLVLAVGDSWGTLAVLLKVVAHHSHGPPFLGLVAGTRPSQGSPLPLTFMFSWLTFSSGSGGFSVSELMFLQRLTGSLSPTDKFGAIFTCPLAEAKSSECCWKRFISFFG